MVPQVGTTSIQFRAPGLDLQRVGDAFSSTFGGSFSFLEQLVWLWEGYSLIAFLFSFICIVGITYAKIRTAQLSDIEQQQLRDAEAAWAHRYGGVASVQNSKWDAVTEHVTSENPNDWRLAIIEADIMLGDALTRVGYVGQTIGEQLKSASPTSLLTLQDAWNAHKIRNQVAHSGSDFVLTKKQAKDAILQYERVLRELGVL